MQPPQNTLVQEIGLIAVSVAIVAGAVTLRILGYIDNTLLLEMIGVVGALWGLNGALKAPSPAQQNQLNAQNVNLQQLVQYALSVLQPQAPVAPPQGQQTAQPVQAPTPVVAPVVPPTPNPGVAATNPDGTTYTPYTVNSGAMSNLVAQPGQFKTIQIPDVSLPMAAVGQGIPLGQ